MKIQIKRTLSAFFCLLLCAILLTGCSKRFSKQDAQGYVQAVLDTVYKGKTVKFPEFVSLTAKDASSIHEEKLDEALHSLEISGMNLSDSTENKLRTSLSDILASSKYTVGVVAETDDGFAVEVEVQEFTMLDTLEEDLLTLAEQREAEIEQIQNEEDLNDFVMELTCEVLEKKALHPTYGEKETAVIYLTEDEEGIYRIDKNNLEALDTLLNTGFF